MTRARSYTNSYKARKGLALHRRRRVLARQYRDRVGGGELGHVDDRSARGVHEVRVAAHAGKRLGVDQVARLRRQRAVQRDDVRALEQLAELDAAGVAAGAALRVDDLQPERAGARRGRAADLAVADDPERLAAQPATEHEVDRPRPRHAGADPPLTLAEPARDREHQRDRQVRGRVGQDAGRVGDRDAMAARGVEVDVVVADGDVGDDAQLLPGGGEEVV